MRKSLVNDATAASTDHRFPTPWTVTEQDGCCVVQDNNGQALSCVYFEDKAGRRVFTRDQACYLAANMAKLPELLREGVAAAESGIPAPLTNHGGKTRRAPIAA